MLDGYCRSGCWRAGWRGAPRARGHVAGSTVAVAAAGEQAGGEHGAWSTVARGQAACGLLPCLCAGWNMQAHTLNVIALRRTHPGGMEAGARGYAPTPLPAAHSRRLKQGGVEAVYDGPHLLGEVHLLGPAGRQEALDRAPGLRVGVGVRVRAKVRGG